MTNAKSTQKFNIKYNDMFTGIRYFRCIFSVQVKAGMKPCEVPYRCMKYTLQEPFKNELERLKEQQIIAPLKVEKTAEQCNSFVILPKYNVTVHFCLNYAWLKEALIREIHRGSTINDMLPKLSCKHDLL